MGSSILEWFNLWILFIQSSWVHILMPDQSDIPTERIHRVVKEHLKPLKTMIEKHEELHDIHTATCVRTEAQLERLQKASEMQEEMLLGKTPPVASEPGMWRMMIDLHEWKLLIDKNFSKIKWTFILAVIGAMGTGVGVLIMAKF
jgi:hypothetical protein